MRIWSAVEGGNLPQQSRKSGREHVREIAEAAGTRAVQPTPVPHVAPRELERVQRKLRAAASSQVQDLQGYSPSDARKYCRAFKMFRSTGVVIQEKFCYEHHRPPGVEKCQRSQCSQKSSPRGQRRKNQRPFNHGRHGFRYRWKKGTWGQVSTRSSENLAGFGEFSLKVLCLLVHVALTL